MTDSNRQSNARAEIARGEETLAAAEVLAGSGLHADAVSRAYYAAFHWARALLFTRGLEAKTHRGLAQLVSLHFVKPGLLAREAAALLARLGTARELSDCAPTATFTEDDARQALADACAFADACLPLIAFQE